MSKHLSQKEWRRLFKKYEVVNRCKFWEGYMVGRGSNYKNGQSTRKWFRNKYWKWKELGDNFFMKKPETRGRKKKIPDAVRDLIDNFTEEQLKEIATRYFEIQEEEKQKSKKKEEASKLNSINISQKAIFFGLHRTTFYKKPKQNKVYKFDKFKDEIIDAFKDNHNAYGRRRMAIILTKNGIVINPRTLGHYMNRYNLITKTRVSKRRRELKNTNVIYKDVVKRNYNPQIDNIIATDVSYIPANEIQNNVYLSIAISHKTKLIESWSLSKRNDNKLVMDTFKDVHQRDGLIIHSDHGYQYSSYDFNSLSKLMKFKISMSRIGNSLDNREAEYFFSNLKGEYLNHINTRKMKCEEIRILIAKYIT